VLVVDDEPQVLSTLTELLQSSGHAVTAAGSGAAGLRAFAPGHFDVVLSNVGMAGMNGWDFIDRLRSVDRDVPVLFITGWGLREEERIRLARLRVHRCLFKPVRPDDLDTAIQEALRPA
jgi:CheY-like chemotaxis protein